MVVTGLELLDAALVDVKTDDSAFAPKFERERQPHITKANDSEF